MAKAMGDARRRRHNQWAIFHTMVIFVRMSDWCEIHVRGLLRTLSDGKQQQQHRQIWYVWADPYHSFRIGLHFTRKPLFHGALKRISIFVDKMTKISMRNQSVWVYKPLQFHFIILYSKQPKIHRIWLNEWSVNSVCPCVFWCVRGERERGRVDERNDILMGNGRMRI